MIQGLFIGLFGMGIFGAILLVLALGVLFMISATTCTLLMGLLEEFGHPLDLGGMKLYIFIIVVAVILIALSELGPICRVVGKAFIIAQFIMIIGGMVAMYLGDRKTVNEMMPYIVIGGSIVALIISLVKTEDVLDFILERPILSILSGIPASFFIFDYIFLMKEEFSDIDSAIVMAQQSLVITLIIFAVFTIFEVLVLVKDKFL